MAPYPGQIFEATAPCYHEATRQAMARRGGIIVIGYCFADCYFAVTLGRFFSINRGAQMMPAATPTVFVVDDDDLVRASIQGMLKSVGLQVRDLRYGARVSAQQTAGRANLPGP